MASLCCKSETHIGYYNTDKTSNAKIAFGTVGTYCNKCGKLCDYVVDGVEHTTDGKLKNKKK